MTSCVELAGLDESCESCEPCEGCGEPADRGAWYEDECRTVKMCGRCGA